MSCDVDGTLSLTFAPALLPASFTLLMVSLKLFAAEPSPLRSLAGRSFRLAIAAWSGARALDSAGSPLALRTAALSRLYVKAPARPALTRVALRPWAPFLNLPSLYGFQIHS